MLTDLRADPLRMRHEERRAARALMLAKRALIEWETQKMGDTSKSTGKGGKQPTQSTTDTTTTTETTTDGTTSGKTSKFRGTNSGNISPKE